MSDNRKYYYLKLKESYFDEDSIVLLESMQDGVLYSNILLKLYLKSLKHGGRLQLDENIPYTAQMIATITRQQIGTVERALQIFLKLGLVELLDTGAYYMSNIELLIGQSSTEGERKRAAKQKNRVLLPARTNGGHLSDIRPPEIELERELKKGQPARAYGRYQNVILADKELADLQAEFPTVWEKYVEKLSAYMESTGKKYKSHAATIRRWASEDSQKATSGTKGGGLPDEETAWIVRKIYDYARNGHGPNYIRRRLEDEEIPAPPSGGNRKKGLRDKRSKFEIADPEHGRFIWDFTTIKKILSNPVYIGVIASQKVVYRFKVGWLSDKKREDWICR